MKIEKVKLTKEQRKEKRAQFINRIKKNVIVNKTKTIILSIILIALYVIINVCALGADLPQYDLTENKLYTLSDASKDVLKKIKTKVNIVAYGFDENSNFDNFLKQYCAANPEFITYEILTEESNNAKVQKYGLSSGYLVVILEAGDKYKLIDAQSEFTVYDYTTYTATDRTEQVLTNGILGLDSKRELKKVYLLDGHGEYTDEEIGSTLSAITLENFEYERINLLTKDVTLGDDDLLLILSPMTDINEIELGKLKDYMNKGVNIMYTQDYTMYDLPNFKTFLSEYGVSITNGYIVETDATYTIAEGSIYFMPQVSSTNNITSEIYSDRYYMMLAQAGKLTFSSDDVLTNLDVKREDLLFTTAGAVFTPNLEKTEETKDALETGEFTIGSILTKTVGEEGKDLTESKLLVISTGSFLTDYYVSEDSYVTISNVGRNRDFFINSISELTDRTNYLKIRKGMDSSTFEPTEEQNKIVLVISFLMPLVIIVIGVIVSRIRKRRK